MAAGQHKPSDIRHPERLLLERRPGLDSFLMHLGWERAATGFQGGAGDSKEGSCRTAELHSVSITQLVKICSGIFNVPSFGRCTNGPSEVLLEMKEGRQP